MNIHTSRIIQVVIAALLALFLASASIALHQCQRADLYASDYKAVCDQLNRTSNDFHTLKVDMQDLRLFNDRVIHTLDSTRRALNIKDKQLQLAGATVQTLTLHDTLRLTDTIFSSREKGWQLDTCLTSPYDTTCLHLEYPGTIATTTTSRSELNVFVINKKETIDPPKKFFLCRWFQRRHTVTTVHIEELNPNIHLNKSVWVIPN